jgi:hypothetical protein
MKEYEVISRLLNSNDNEIYEYLCELDLRKNGREVESIFRKLNLTHREAPRIYNKWVENIRI